MRRSDYGGAAQRGSGKACSGGRGRSNSAPHAATGDAIQQRQREAARAALGKPNDRTEPRQHRVDGGLLRAHGGVHWAPTILGAADANAGNTEQHRRDTQRRMVQPRQQCSNARAQGDKARGQKQPLHGRDHGVEREARGPPPPRLPQGVGAAGTD